MGETVNKLASIFTQAAADAAFDEIQLSESEKMDKAIKAVKGALDKAHTGILARIEAKPLHGILSNYCREDAILLINKFVKIRYSYSLLCGDYRGKHENACIKVVERDFWDFEGRR